MGKERVREFLVKKKDKIKNPIIRGFLSQKRNLLLLMQFLDDPSESNKRKVDEAFCRHYKEVQKTRYISNLIHFYSMDFDKKRRRQDDRVLLILDKNADDDSTTSIGELVSDYSSELEFNYESLLDSIEDEQLIEALKSLSDKQLLVLELIYFKGLTLKEISKIIQTTPQNVSNLHRKSLKKLKQILIEEGKYELPK